MLKLDLKTLHISTDDLAYWQKNVWFVAWCSVEFKCLTVRVEQNRKFGCLKFHLSSSRLFLCHYCMLNYAYDTASNTYK